MGLKSLAIGLARLFFLSRFKAKHINTGFAIQQQVCFKTVQMRLDSDFAFEVKNRCGGSGGIPKCGFSIKAIQEACGEAIVPSEKGCKIGVNLSYYFGLRANQNPIKALPVGCVRVIEWK